MTWWGYKAMGKAVSVGARQGADMGEAIGAQASLYAAGRGARRGFLAPGDPTPPPNATSDYLDYRGVAPWQDVKPLAGCQFPLGRYTNLKKGGRPAHHVGLPAEVVARHSVIVGPAGSGKTHSLIVPWIHAALVEGWAVVALDVKGDLSEDYLRFKETSGSGPLGAQLRRWDFTDPRASTPWEWTAELRDDARVDAAITALLGRRTDHSGTDPFFYRRDYRTLRGLLLFSRATLPECRTAGDLVRLLESDAELERLVVDSPRAPGAADLLAALRQTGGEYAKVISGVVAALSPLDSPAVEAVTRSSTARPSLDLGQALGDHGLLVVGAPLRGGEVSAALAGLMLNQLAQRLYERFGSQQRPVLLVIDEAPQIVDRVDVAQLMEVSRSAGVGVVAAMQDVAQIKDENDRSSILSNAAAFAILPGASPMSVMEFGKRLGQRFERTTGLTVSGRAMGSPTQTLGTEAVPVLRDREIMHPPFGARAAFVHIKAPELRVTAKPLLVDMQRDA
jgi:type IV secretory pathway TraG/TraD family ATPase VirD4